MSKVIIFAAPSGSGKSTIINYLLNEVGFDLHFSISATSRAPRGEEKNGVEYFFLTPDEFRQKIQNEEFLEYEEVFADQFYGTLKAQVEERLANGEDLIFDVDVKGALNIKRYFGKRALALFIQPPSVEALRQRLQGRGTETPEQIEKRVSRAEFEMSFAKEFDEVIINDNLEIAQVEAESLVEDFLDE